MRRAFISSVGLAVVVGGLGGLLSGLWLIDRWGWPDLAVVLRELARHSQGGLFIGLAVGIGLFGLVAAGRLALQHASAGSRPRRMDQLTAGLWAAGLLLFVCGRATSGRLLVGLNADLPPGFADLGLAVALVLGLSVLARAWAAPQEAGREKPLAVGVLLTLLLVGGLQSLSVVQLRRGAESPNVLLLVVDCLRSDHLGAYGYERPTSPVVDRLAERGLVFENAYTTASWTKPAVGSIITGQQPQRHGALRKSDSLAPKVSTLAERLGGEGYHTLFLGGNAWISDAFNFAQGYDSFAIHHEKTGDELALLLLDELAALEDRPFFAYLHLMDVHLPYNFNRYNGLFSAEGEGAAILGSGMLNSSWARRRTAAGLMTLEDRTRLRGLYDGQIRFVDEQIGIVLGTLENRGLLRNTLVILTADHGEEFWEHGNFEHGHSVHEEVLRVPLIVHGAGIRRGRVARAVSLIDIAPTIAAFTGIDVEEGAFDGRVLTDPLVEDRRLVAVSTLYGRERFAAFDGRRKVTLSSAPTLDGWRLVGEQSELEHEVHAQAGWVAEKRPDGTLAALSDEERSALEDIRRLSLSQLSTDAVMKDELLERFRALGYMD